MVTPARNAKLNCFEFEAFSSDPLIGLMHCVNGTGVLKVHGLGLPVTDNTISC